jgi:hypothetical protein
MSEVNVGIDGYFDLVVTNKRGKQRRYSFENLVLNSGLERLGTDAAITVCAIGAGTSVPIASQTALQAISASTSTTLTGAPTDSGGLTPYWVGYTYGFRFPIGSLGGNYTEIGVGWAAGSMYARALIQNAGGTPVSISIGAGEQLDVFYTRRIYPPLVDVVSVQTINGVATTVTVRAAQAGSTSWWAANEYPRYGGSPVGINCEIFDGVLGAINAAPSGTSNAPSSVTVQPYVSSSFTRNVSITIPNAVGNFATGIKSSRLWLRMASFQFGFVPAVVKTSANVVTFNYSVTWGRRP